MSSFCQSKSTGTQCGLWFVLHRIVPPVCCSMHKENMAFIPRSHASKYPYHAHQILYMQGQVFGTSFWQLPSQDRIALCGQPSWIAIMSPVFMGEGFETFSLAACKKPHFGYGCIFIMQYSVCQRHKDMYYAQF